MKFMLPVLLLILAGCGGEGLPGTSKPAELVPSNGNNAYYLNKLFHPKKAVTMNQIPTVGSRANPAAVQKIWSFIKQAKPTGKKVNSEDWATKRDLRLRVDEAGKPKVLMDASGQIAWEHKIWKLTPKQLSDFREFLDRAALSN